MLYWLTAFFLVISQSKPISIIASIWMFFKFVEVHSQFNQCAVAVCSQIFSSGLMVILNFKIIIKNLFRFRCIHSKCWCVQRHSKIQTALKLIFGFISKVSVLNFLNKFWFSKTILATFWRFYFLGFPLNLAVLLEELCLF